MAKMLPAINAMLDKLDAADDSKFRNRRQAQRCPYRRIDVPVRISHPGGSVTNKVVATRNLSSTGIGFLYTSFLHIGTQVEVLLPRRIGGEDMLRGKVIFCGHVSGAYHQIGVKLDQKIAPKVYVDRASLEKMEGAGQPPTTLAGAVLHIDDGEVDRKLMAHHLKSTKVELTSVANEADAVAAVRVTRFDLVLCDMNLKTTTAEVVIGQLREAGYAGRIIVVTAETSGERLRAVKQAGAVAMLGKPYDQAKLFSLIGVFLKRVAATDGGIVSTLAGQMEMKSLIERYVQNVHQLAADIETATKENQIDRLRQICVSLKGSGTSYGFASVSELAKEALRTLDATMSLEESVEQVKKLADVCRRVITA